MIRESKHQSQSPSVIYVERQKMVESPLKCVGDKELRNTKAQGSYKKQKLIKNDAVAC